MFAAAALAWRRVDGVQAVRHGVSHMHMSCEHADAPGTKVQTVGGGIADAARAIARAGPKAVG
ncbi:hypothetical protein [Mycobacterium noviomagense]|uniref:Uncharacterized protein n=1 Tax=Mycobacterium noviomagense TaxID=459858 RepID=A0A7I7PCD3_9MYCO|nr:hypothetical protein [Mycobacterium noviomagense]BBY06260.1 hypothetical protein MNVI_15780 [Mycobacterium noviomagense]